LIIAFTFVNAPLLADEFHGGLLDAVFITLQNEQTIASSQQQIIGTEGQVFNRSQRF
jgi:hypothetical protein